MRELELPKSWPGDEFFKLRKSKFWERQFSSIVTFKDTLKAFDENKSAWSNFFRYVKVCIFWTSIQYTIHWDKTQMLKKISLDKINGTKNALFFLSQAPTHHGFTFNLRFLYELKHKIPLSKTVCGIFHFRFCFVFVKVYIFVRQNAWTLLL